VATLRSLAHGESLEQGQRSRTHSVLAIDISWKNVFHTLRYRFTNAF
jgi:hypothetical protein